MPFRDSMDRAENATLLTNKLFIKPECIVDFADWQAQLNAAIAASPGFVSLEILSPIYPLQPGWLLIQRFYTHENMLDWHHSDTRKKLLEELNPYLAGSYQESVQEAFSSSGDMQGGVTEVFVTQITPEKEKIYREWTAKIHQAEAKFPGFKRVYMQSPQKGGLNWMTLLQFDTPENLDRWLHSSERQKVLDEAKPLILSLESHRMISPYAGWFAPLAQQAGEAPPVWKQTMIVLLVLFPIVALELKYLSLLTTGLNVSLATFIGNALSVTLIAWPMMPMTLFFLGWWLMPKSEKRRQATLVGTLLMMILYLIEIAIFWNFL